MHNSWHVVQQHWHESYLRTTHNIIEFWHISIGYRSPIGSCENCVKSMCSSTCSDRELLVPFYCPIGLIPILYKIPITLFSTLLHYQTQGGKIRLSLSKSRESISIYFGIISPTADGFRSIGNGFHRDFDSLSFSTTITFLVLFWDGLCWCSNGLYIIPWDHRNLPTTHIHGIR